MNGMKIAKEMFSDGLRARDCETWDRLKKYDEQSANEILENLAEIEIKHLQSIGNRKK